MTSKNTHIYYDNYSPDEHFHTEYENTTRDYGYNLQNKMESYDGKDQTATYVYDGTGTRIGKTVNGVSTGQIWNNGNVIAEYGTKGTETYIRGAGGEIVKTKDSANNSRYFSYNAHGDTTNIIEKNAESTLFAVTAAYEYDAFGGLVSGTGGGEADSNAFRYNGQYTDEETGLIYLRNRYYDPSIGRFTQEDTYWNPTNMIYGNNRSNIVVSYKNSKNIQEKIGDDIKFNNFISYNNFISVPEERFDVFISEHYKNEKALGTISYYKQE